MEHTNSVTHCCACNRDEDDLSRESQTLNAALHCFDSSDSELRELATQILRKRMGAALLPNLRG